LLFFVVAIFAGALLAPLVARHLPRHAGWALAMLPAAATTWFATRVPMVSGGEILRESIDWVPALQVRLSFQLDGLGLLFAFLVTLIGTLIIIYSGGYLKGDPRLGRFLSFMLLFMGSMLGLVLANNVITLFVFWELTSVTSFLLIGFDHEDARSRRSALQALLVTGGGGLALLAGLVLMAIAGGSYELSELLTRGDIFREHPWYAGILVLVLLGAFTKSAQVPFHFWLPNAMDAPTPVSAYLHSATMVKAGVYLLARLHPALGGTDPWTWTLVIVGGMTALTGGILAVRQTDLKRVLAYTTVAALGQLVVLAGLGTTHGIQAFVVYLFAHSLYKGALFMGVGAVDHETGTREIGHLGGLRAAMPLTALAVGLAALSNAGLPPFFGFIGKEVLYTGSLEAPDIGRVVAGLMVVVNALLMTSAGLVFLKPFLGRRVATPKSPHEAPVSLWLGPLVLGSLGLLFGVFHVLPGRGFVSAAVASIAGRPQEVVLHLWKGLDPALMHSGVTVLAGVLLYLSWPRVKAGLDRIDGWIGISSDRGWDRSIKGLVSLAEWQTRAIQGGYLRSYLRTTLAFVTLAVGGTLVFKGGFPIHIPLPEAPVTHWMLALLILASVVTTLLAHAATTAILSLGVMGMAIALLFLLFGAPDVAITQFMVETLIVIIVALVLFRLPSLTPFRTSLGRERIFNAVVAVGFGAVVTAIAMSLSSMPFDPTLGNYFAEHSVPGGHGRNIVNVILVDFRALDTLGEILVVSIAGLGAFSLLRMRRGGR
jgi:multicomponent Na+:H+ antiporter subunit A